MNFKRIANSLVTRLVGVGLVLVTVGTVISYFQLSRFLREDLTQVVSAQQVTIAEYVARDIDANLRERQHFVEQIARSVPRTLLTQPGPLADWLRERHKLLPLSFQTLLLADAQGRVLTGFPSYPGLIGLSIAENPGFRAVSQGRSGIGQPLLGPVLKQPLLPIGAPVQDADGRVLAVVIGTTELGPHGFLNRLLQVRIGQSGGMLLISPQDQMFVAATDPAMVFKPTPPAGVNALHDRAMAGFRGTGTTVNTAGVEEISAIASVPSTGWFVVARMPTREALVTVSRVQAFIVQQRLPGTIIAMALLALLIAWILRPLYRAARQAEAMTQGHLPLAPLQVVREDEVGHLTQAFNGLLAKLTSHQSELSWLAYHDSLTGLPNRKLLADRLQQALARSRRNATHVALLYLDLDGFKAINDTLGHDAGDQALKEIARRLLAVVRQADTVARMGGDEFVVLAPDLDEPAASGAVALAQKCIAAVAVPLQLGQAEHRLGVSIGIALSGGEGSPEQLLAAADKAMYGAKLTGQGGYAMA